jgi:hypothetical protein
VGTPSGVRRAGCCHRGSHCEVVGIHAVDPGHRGAHLACRRCRHVGRVLLVPARDSRATTGVLVDEIHAHPRHGPRQVVGPELLTAPPFAVASAAVSRPTGTVPKCRRISASELLNSQFLRPRSPVSGGSRHPTHRSITNYLHRSQSTLLAATIAPVSGARTKRAERTARAVDRLNLTG